MNKYELAVLYHPDLEVDISKAEEKVKKIIISSGGKIKNIDNWGKRKLAYPIVKQNYAVYVFYAVEVPGENVQKTESALNITDEVIRYLITKLDLNAIAKAEAAKADKAKKVAMAPQNTEEKVLKAERGDSSEPKKKNSDFDKKLP